MTGKRRVQDKIFCLGLKSKAGENTIRSFRRFAARLITRTFKTVLSESLLVLTNLLPLHLQLLKLVGSRYLSTKMEDCFSPSSFKYWSLVLHSSSATLGLLCLINFTIMINPLGMLIPSSLPPNHGTLRLFISEFSEFMCYSEFLCGCVSCHGGHSYLQ